MKLSRLFFLFAAVLFAASCSTVKSLPLNSTYEQEFIGKSSAYVQYVCGSPTRVERDVNGGQVLMYEDIEDFVMHTRIEAYAAGDGAFVQFFFDKDDSCYSVRTNHVRRVKEIDKHLTWATVTSSVGGSAVLTGLLLVITSLFARR